MCMDMLKVLPNELQFGAVAVNDAPVYSCFSVLNTDPVVSLSVQLTATTVPAAVRFKLWDDMALLDDGDDVDDGCWPTDLQRGCPLFRYYNAVFDDAYIVNGVVLRPLESKNIVAIFHADPTQFPNVMMQAPPMMVSGVIHVTAASLSRESVCTFDDTENSKTNRDSVRISDAPSCLSNTADIVPESNQINNQTVGSGRTKEERSANFDEPNLGILRTSNSLSIFSSAAARTPLYAVRSETATLPFSAAVYVSWLTVSKSELQTTMAPNKTHLMDFTVTNTSSLPLPFVIRMQTIPQKNIDFAVYEEDKFDEPRLGRTLLLGSHAFMNLTLMVRTAATALEDSTTGVRYYRTILQCDNLRDSRNTELVYVCVNVVASESQRDLVSIGTPVLDFGEVYRGTQVLRTLSFSTTTREDMTIRLLDSRPQHCEGALSLVRVNTTDNSDASNIATSGNVGMLHVDELVIAPPKGTATVGVVYVPSTDQGRKGTSNLKFELELVITGCSSDSGGSRRQQQVVVRCVATLFTSTIVASQKNINFGDCQVGQTRRCTFEIENQSPLPTTINVQLRSKIVSIEGIQPRTLATGGRETVGEFSIAPRSSLPLTLRINPQRVNPTYQKQLIIGNVSNPAEDRLIVNIEANNMAPSEAKLHDKLYTCEPKFDCGYGNGSDSTDSVRGTHDVTYASSLRALTNVPLIVAYVLRSKVDYPLVLQLRCSSSELEAFCLEGISAAQFEQLAEELRTCCCFGGSGSGAGSVEDAAQQLLIERAEEVRKSITKTLYQHAVATSSVILEPHGSCTFYVNICRTVGSCDVVTKEDGVSIALEGLEMPRFMRLSYRLCATRFELGGQKTKNFGEVNIGERKTTKLPIVNQCNSQLLLKLSKSRSVAAGYIRMENSEKNSVYCLIRPYATKELELSFYPGIKGSFEERIQLTNVLDPQNEVIMTLKATITKAETFDISPDSWSFGAVPVPRLAQQLPRQSLQGSVAVGREDGGEVGVRVGARFTVVNTSTTRRALCLRLLSPSAVGTFCGRTFFGHSGAGVINSSDVCPVGSASSDGAANTVDRFFRFDGVEVRLQLEMEHGGASSGSSRNLEEKIENLEQKLKIYLRKNKGEKIEATKRQIDALRRALMGEKVHLNTTSAQRFSEGGCDELGNSDKQEEEEQQQQWGYSELSKSEDSQAIIKPRFRSLQHSELLSLLLRDGVELPEMNAGESTIIILVLTCIRTKECIPLAQSGSITFLLYETNDKEANRVIPVDVTLVCMQGEGDLLPTSCFPDTTAPAAAPLASGKKTQMMSLTSVLNRQALGEPQTSSARNRSLVTSGVDTSNVLVPLSTSSISMVSVPPLPSFVVSVGRDDNVIASTFMDYPMALLVHSVVYEPCRFSMFVRATRDVSVAVLNPVCCGDSMNSKITIISDLVDFNVGDLSKYGNYSAHVDGASLPPSTPLVSDALTNFLEARFNFTPRNGHVRRNESLCITVECTPMSLVPHRYFIPVRDLQNAFNVEYLVLGLNPRGGEDLLDVFPKELQWPDILMPCEKHRLAVQSFVVHSHLTVPHALVIRSNRPSFISFFMDEECTVSLVNPLMGISREKKLCVYVRFSPSERSWRHESRVLVAGISVEAVAVDVHAELVSSRVLVQAFVRLAARVGSGELLLRKSFIDLGVMPPQCCFANAVVTVVNPSDRFEIFARLEGSSTFIVLKTPELTLPPKSEASVEVKLQLPASGLVRESLSVYNLSCKQKPLTVEILVLRRDEAISARVVNEDEKLFCNNHYNDEKRLQEQQRETQCMDSGSGDALGTLAHRCYNPEDNSTEGSGVVVFPAAAVVLGEDGVFVLHSTVTAASLHVTNHSTRDFILVSKGSAPFLFGSVNSSPFLDDTLLSPLTLSSHAHPRGRVRLDAHQTEVLTWTLLAMPSLSVEQTRQLMQQRLLTMEVVMQVCVAQVIDEMVGFNYNALLFCTKRALPAVGQCVLLPKFLLTFAISEGRAAPPLIDLGVVGIGKGGSVTDEANAFTENEGNHGSLMQDSSFTHRHALSAISNSRWMDSCGSRGSGSSSSTPVVICLTNLSPVLPLRLNVECEPTVRFTSNRIVVPPLQTVAVEAFLVLKLIQRQGPFCFAVYFVNELNPENDMLVHVKGQYYWKAVELSCDGVMDGERESFSMEALRVRRTLAAGDILSESKIVMMAIEPRVEVEVSVKENPKLKGIIQLQALQYDATEFVKRIVFGQSKHTSTNVAAVSAAVNRGGNSVGNRAGCGCGAADCGASSVMALQASLTGGPNVRSGINTCKNSCGGVLTTSLLSSASLSAPVSSLGTTDSLSMTTHSRQKEQYSFRLRCVLIKEDFAALFAAFYGQRKSKQIMDLISEQQSIAFDKIIELVELRRNTGSATMWLGTLGFSNTLTEGEDEVQIFSTLDAFQTFDVSTHLTLTPCIFSDVLTSASTATVFSPTARTANGGTRAETGGLNCGMNNVYVGELVVTNPCLQHHVALSVTSFKDSVYKDVVSVHCIPFDEESPLSPITDKSGFSDALHNPTMTRNEFIRKSSAASVTIATSTTTTTSTTTSFSSTINTVTKALDAGETRTVFLSISPQSSRRIQVVMRVELKKHQPSIDQAVLLALFDESVQSSAVVVRIGLAPLDETVQQQHQKQQIFCSLSVPRAEVTGSSSANRLAAPGGRGAAAGCGDGGGAAADSECTKEPATEYGVGGDKTALASLTAGTSSTVSAIQMTSVGLTHSVHEKAESLQLPQCALSLHGNCRAVSGCSGVYACSFSYTKELPPATNITICNNLDDVVVEYSVVIVSQAPYPWLLLPSATAVLGPRETQPLRLDILSTDAGSFNGYVSIFNNAVPGEVLLLQLSAEVFVPSAGEGLFEIITSNGQRVMTNTERDVFIGRLFGEGTQRAYVAFAIVNRASISLEFSVAVVRPFRMDFVNAVDEESDIDLTTNIITSAAVETGVASSTDNSAAHGVIDKVIEMQKTGCGGADCDDSKRRQQTFSIGSRPECDVRLLVCNMHEVPYMCDQKRLVVAPKSRVKVIFFLFCDRLSLSAGFVAHGEAEVVLKCRQARDAKFVFKAHFDICSPSMRVPRQLFFTPEDNYTMSIPVTNLRSREIRVTFCTFSPVIDILRPEKTKGEVTGGGYKDQLQHTSQQENTIGIIIGAGSTTTISVRLNVVRLTALLRSWNAYGDVATALPTLCDRGLLLDADNPTERLFLELCYTLPGASAITERDFVAAIAAAHPVAKSLRLGYRQISEQRLFRFVQNFWRVLSEAAEVLLPEFRYYAEQRGMDAPDATAGELVCGGNGTGGSGDISRSFHACIGMSCWAALRSLLVDLICIVEELLYESVILANMWLIDTRAVFLASSVTSHQLIRAWRQYRQNLPTTRPFVVFGQYLETIDILSCLTSFSD